MRRASHSPFAAAVLALMTALSGCGESAGPAGSTVNPAGPHGGPVVVLDDQTSAEVVVEYPATKRATEPSLAVYFLKPDLQAPADAKPESVKVAILLPGAEAPKPVDLQPQPQAKDKLGANRFASKPGPYDTDQPQGELTVTLGGQAVTKPFRH